VRFTRATTCGRAPATSGAPGDASASQAMS
jgi:hypothetical protein